MTDWNEQAAPNNNLGSTAAKKALSANPKTNSLKEQKNQKKNDLH
ncbi:hypothetical protein [Bacillus sp. P14.5]|nr:hypothetical protein [Bacillus sp. P14.5]